MATRQNGEQQKETSASDRVAPPPRAFAVPAGLRDGMEPVFLRIPRLAVLVVGTGRDGTNSLRQLIENLAQANGVEWSVQHDLHYSAVGNLVTLYRETGQPFYRDTLRELLRYVAAHVLVGTCYQHALDLFAELHGPQLRLIHVKRHDRAECIRSLAQIIYYRPAMAIHFTPDACRPDHPDYTRWMTAWHFGEMTRQQWEALSLEEKLAWHYDRTHATIEAAKPRFAHTLDLCTEHLSEPETIRRLAAFLHPDWQRSCAGVRLWSRAEISEKAEENEAIRQAMLLKPAPD